MSLYFQELFLFIAFWIILYIDKSQLNLNLSILRQEVSKEEGISNFDIVSYVYF